MIAFKGPRFAVSLEDQDGQLDFLRDQQPFYEDGMECPVCELCRLEAQAMRQATRRLRLWFWLLSMVAVLFWWLAITLVPHAAGYLFVVLGYWTTFLCGDLNGQIEARKDFYGQP